MQKFFSLICAIDFIEKNLFQPITLEEIACASYISLSHLHKLFDRVLQVSPMEYITKRRLSFAANKLINSNLPVTDIAFDCQYGSLESFSRAFKRQFLVAPNVFRKEKSKFYELFPKIATQGGFISMTHKHTQKKYDFSQTAERILSSKGTYIMVADIDCLEPINKNLGHDAGDAAIAETAARIERSIDDGMIFYRTGGDDFTILTNTENLTVCQEVANKILSYAGNDVIWSGEAFKFSVSIGISMIPKDLVDANIAFDNAMSAAMEAKKESRNTYKLG